MHFSSSCSIIFDYRIHMIFMLFVLWTKKYIITTGLQWLEHFMVFFYKYLNSSYVYFVFNACTFFQLSARVGITKKNLTKKQFFILIASTEKFHFCYTKQFLCVLTFYECFIWNENFGERPNLMNLIFSRDHWEINFGKKKLQPKNSHLCPTAV